MSHYVEPTLYGEYKGGKTTTYNVVFVIILPVCSVYKAVSAQSGKSATFVFVFVRMARYPVPFYPHFPCKLFVCAHVTSTTSCSTLSSCQNSFPRCRENRCMARFPRHLCQGQYNIRCLIPVFPSWCTSAPFQCRTLWKAKDRCFSRVNTRLSLDAREASTR